MNTHGALRLGLSCVAMVLTSLPALTARAEGLRFISTDIPTVFFISKSDDHNRVDYGMRLNAACSAVDNDAVFPYWRELEHAPPVHTHPLGAFEYFAYGLSEQRSVRRMPTGGQYLVRLKQFGKRAIWIDTKREPDGRCSALARCTIAGVKFAHLNSIYVQLAGPLKVSYVIVKGKNLDTGAEVTERLNP